MKRMIDSKIFSEEIRGSFKWLIDLGFQFRQLDASIFFEQTKADEAFAIGFSWSEYNRIQLYGLTAYKRFDLIEGVIQKATGSPADYTIKHRWQGNIPRGIEWISDKSNPFYNSFYLEDKSQVGMFSEMVERFLLHDAKAFFKRFESVQDVLKWLKAHAIQQHAELLVQNNNAQVLRKLVIMKESRSLDFADLYQRYRSFLKDKVVKNESPYSEMYRAFSKLDTYFNQLE